MKRQHMLQRWEWTIQALVSSQSDNNTARQHQPKSHHIHIHQLGMEHKVSFLLTYSQAPKESNDAMRIAMVHRISRISMAQRSIYVSKNTVRTCVADNDCYSHP
ncbi:hypothetical protein M426DRAFT_323484 [Hypoxylon sp. CI-4A]|nr:hypothetical protein M426DRAFT_323484 [Hypoxylon sp. CI-4A]